MATHSGYVTQAGATPEGKARWLAGCGCGWEADQTNTNKNNADRRLRRHLDQARAEPRAPFFHVTMGPDPGSEVYHLRRDPAQPFPDYTVTRMGEAHHLIEFGHPAAVGCCPNVDHNGRHLLPQHRRSA